MSMQSIVQKGREFASQVSLTVVQCAIGIANECWNTYEFELTEKEAGAIAKEIGGDVPARVSEWKAFMLAVPCGLPEALEVYHADQSLTLTRVKLFALARELKKVGDYTKAGTVVKRVEKSGGKPAKGAGRKATVEMGLGIVKNAETSKHLKSKAKMNAFRRELAELCEKHGIKY